MNIKNASAFACTFLSGQTPLSPCRRRCPKIVSLPEPEYYLSAMDPLPHQWERDRPDDNILRERNLAKRTEHYVLWLRSPSAETNETDVVSKKCLQTVPFRYPPLQATAVVTLTSKSTPVDLPPSQPDHSSLPMSAMPAFVRWPC